MAGRLWRRGMLALAFAWLCAGNARAECKLQAFLTLPVTMSGSQPLVTVGLNGTEVRMLLDTGAFFSFVTPEAARRASLTVGLAPEGLRVAGVGGEATPELANVKDFRLGNQALHRVDLLVYGDRLGADGILGQNILRLGAIELDLANGVVRLLKASGCAHANLAYWARGTPVGVLNIRNTEVRSPQIVASAQLNGKNINVMFDTGAGSSHLSLRAAANAGVTPQSPGVVPGGLRFGIGSAARDSWIAPFRSFTLDIEQTLNTRIRIGDLGALPGDVDMLLGADFFLSHHVLIDYGERRLFFTYNGGPVFDLSVRGPAQAAANASPAGSSPGPDAAELDRRAQASLARNELPAAIADLGLAVAADPGNPQYRLHRAAALERSGDVRSSLSDLDAALRLQPNLTEALMLRADIRIRHNDLDGARADFAAAETGAPGRYELQLQEAGAYTATERYPLALELLNRWIAAHSQDERLYDALAERCLVRGMLGQELDAALSDCNSARRHESGNSQVLYARGIVQLRRKDYARAIADFSDTLALQPRFAPALYARGLARTGKGDRAAGATDMQAASALLPTVARPFRDVGLTP